MIQRKTVAYRYVDRKRHRQTEKKHLKTWTFGHTIDKKYERSVYALKMKHNTDAAKLKQRKG